MPNLNFDFSGYATKNNLKCNDGRTILPGAFKEADGVTVPLVWQHLHDEPGNVLGHAILENREDGVYTYGYFNDSEEAKKAKILVQHKDIQSLSIYANNLVEKSKNVVHGVIREVSLVLSGSNPGALIDNVSISHGDGTETKFEDEAIIYTDLPIDLPQENDSSKSKNDKEEDKEEDKELSHADTEEKDETIKEIFETLNDKQKNAVYAIVGQLMENDEEVEHSSDSNSNSKEEGDSKKIMKRNVFDGSAMNDENRPKLSHAEFSAIAAKAKELGGSLKAAFLASEAGVEFLAHAGTYGIDNISYLFPDARSVTREPTFIARKMGWVAKVMSGINSSPFSRIKSMHADITPDAARARGYVTGNLKVEEVFAALRRITTPQTIYKKQKLDRDDIIDITDFSVVSWLKGEMRMLLDEELARAILVSDGRDPVAQVDDKIVETNIRPIWKDEATYVHKLQVPSSTTTDELIDAIIGMFDYYRGSGDPTMFCAPTLLTSMLLLKDTTGRRLYRTTAELAAELRVSEIVSVPVMEGLQQGTPTAYYLRAIIVNLDDYTVGTDKGGEINFFDDFDIDYNQYKYLIETRASGALVVPKSALVLEENVV